jgi:hypothetical protein
MQSQDINIGIKTVDLTFKKGIPASEYNGFNLRLPLSDLNNIKKRHTDGKPVILNLTSYQCGLSATQINSISLLDIEYCKKTDTRTEFVFNEFADTTPMLTVTAIPSIDHDENNEF